MENLVRKGLFGVAVAGLMFCGMVTSAGATIIGTEDSETGFVGDLFSGLFGANSGYIVASDGEATFDPFGYGL